MDPVVAKVFLNNLADENLDKMGAAQWRTPAQEARNRHGEIKTKNPKGKVTAPWPA